MGIIISENDKFIGLHVRHELREELRRLAKLHGTTVAEMVRAILEKEYGCRQS